MVLCVELGEQISVGIALHLESKGRGARGSLLAERLHVEDGQTELVVDCPADRLTPRTRDVQVRHVPPSPVGDREDFIGREEAKERDGDPHSENDPEHDVRGMVDGEIHAGEPENSDQSPCCPLGPVPRASRHHQAVEHADEDGGEHGRGR